MAEFTGERVIPGQVDTDLWNEHLARYYFVARLCRGKRVLDIGTGSGYGAAELAKSAATVIGLDVARDAIAFATQHYTASNLRFIQATGTRLPFPDGVIDLVVGFEMIEHLDDWRMLLRESRRVLSPAGQLVISTPNKDFYAEFRQQSGPNPYHVHEFAFREFADALREHFPSVSLFVQNHGSSIVFQPVERPTGAQVHVEGAGLSPLESNFFLAVCALAPQTGAPTFVHVPTSANVLRERGRHIQLLEGELATKDKWLEKAKSELQELHVKHRALVRELEKQNTWAEELNAELEEARRHLDEIHAAKDAEIAAISSGYEEKVASLELESEKQSRWAMKTQQDLETKIEELAKSVQALHEAEKTVAERTAWAQRLDEEVAALQAKLSMVEASRWVRLGRKIGLGPGAKQK